MNPRLKAVLQAAVPPIGFAVAAFLLWKAAMPTLNWLGHFFAFPLFVIQHWGELPGSTRQLFVLLVLGLVFSVVIISLAFWGFVWRSWCPDLDREDEYGGRTRYGRAYWTTPARVYCKIPGRFHWPWKFDVLTIPTGVTTEREAFKLIVPSARFENPRAWEWEAIALDSEHAVPRTTKVDPDVFDEWTETDLTQKKTIAREGAQGHITTQRQKILNNRMDPTQVKWGTVQKRELKRRITPIKPTTNGHKKPTEDEGLVSVAVESPVVNDEEGPA